MSASEHVSASPRQWDLGISDLCAREQTRVTLIYGLYHQLPLDTSKNAPLNGTMPFGRFTPHMEASASMLPTVVSETHLDKVPIEIRGEALPVAIESACVTLTATPRCDAVLLVDVTLSYPHTVDDVAKLLAVTCFDRWSVTVGGAPILRWLHKQISEDYAINSEKFEFGNNVHQMVFPSQTLSKQLTAAETPPLAEVSRIVYRGTLAVAAPVRAPSTLNHSGRTLTVHGRGVSVISGWGLHVENSFLVVAMTLISTLGVVQRTRRNAFTALKLNDNISLDSTADARTLIARLAGQLTEMQLDLSFGVEAFVDSVFIPELLVESFQASLRDAVGITGALDNTSRMLTRLQSVINARLQTLEAAVQERQEQRSKVIAYILAVGTLIAAPPALLLAFFSVQATEVRATDSMFDFARYWPAYALSWLPFITLVLGGWLFLRKAGHLPSVSNKGMAKINREVYRRFDDLISQ